MVQQMDIAWDGVARGYKPPEVLRISPKLQLHTQGNSDVDPVTFEVVRNTILNINFEHGQTIQKLSISPVTMITRDFQTSILTESGDVMCLGPYLLYLGNTLSLTTKWILENRSEEPGIEDGDVFLCNDPYVGTAHQQDTGLTSPIFWDGELFCWVSNSVHYSDVGGPVPGSFCVAAREIWEEPPCFPPIKLMERGKLRVDVEQVFLRQSRLPNTVRMDLHAAIAGIEVSRERILQLIQRYGPETIKSAMYRILDAGELAFVEKLRMIPDGRWSERVYTEAALPGDRGIYLTQTNIVKEGDFLYVDNEGTSPQAGSLNNTYAAFVGGTLAAITIMLGYDVAGACGGLYRRVKFRPVPGTLTCADHPAPISAAGVYCTARVVAAATGAVAKMIVCADETLRGKAIAMGDVHPTSGHIYSGVNQYGQFVVAMSAGLAIGALPASPGRDGVDTGGVFWVPGMDGANAEENEMSWPILTLCRRENAADAAGAGQFRGGRGFDEVLTLHDGQRVDMVVYLNESFVKTQGLLGGNPGGRPFFRVKRNTDVNQIMAAGGMPHGFDNVTGEEVPVFFKGMPIPINANDVWSTNVPNGTGYGDPLDREPSRVAKDVADGKMTVFDAQHTYGVVIGADGEINVDETRVCQAEMLRQRLA